MNDRDALTVTVLGAGAVGGWIAGRLALAGNRVMALTTGGPLDQVRISERGETSTADLVVHDRPADLLIIAVKAHALPGLAHTLGELIGPDTIVLPKINGVPWWFVDGMPLRSVDPGGDIARTIPFPQLLGCVVHASAHRTAPGEVTVKHSDRLIIGEPLGGRSERAERIARLFERAGIRADVSDDVRGAIWYKLWGNATINPMSALVRTTCDRILADLECRAWMLEGMAELAEVGAAIGCPISESGEERMAVTARLGAFKTSMLQDVEAGRRIELEALLGAPREIARRHGIATPALDRLYGVTRLMAESSGLL